MTRTRSRPRSRHRGSASESEPYGHSIVPRSRQFADDGDTEVHIFEHYRDSPAALAHGATFDERYTERFVACVHVLEFDVSGDPNAALRNAIGGLGPTYHHLWGGFTRFS